MKYLDSNSEFLEVYAWNEGKLNNIVHQVPIKTPIPHNKPNASPAAFVSSFIWNLLHFLYLILHYMDH